MTPDSFSDGGLYADADLAVDAGLSMLASGADALDVGGESTRPGAAAVPTGEQLRRVLPVIERLRGQTDAPISIDTRDPRVGEAALEAGADVVNDVSACRDPGWLRVLGHFDAPVILMHMRGIPEDMQHQTEYPHGVVGEVCAFLRQRMDWLESQGISRSRVILDPGIGFAKTPEQNLEVLRQLGAVRQIGRPVLLGLSRKVFLRRILGASRPLVRERPADRDIGTVAANAFGLMAGALILRVHNVALTRDLVDVFEALQVYA